MTDFNANFEINNQGYLIRFNDWQPLFAEQAAKAHHIELNDTHWRIIHLLRECYNTTQISPNTRALVKLVKQHLGSDIGNSVSLMQLFTGQPALIASKISGLPKPKQCF